MSVCVVGRGKVGRSLLGALRAADVAATSVPGTRFRRPRAHVRLYVLAVPDAAIAAIASAIARTPDRRTATLHVAGARGLDELAPLARAGMPIGVFHPLVSFASPAHAPALRGATFTCFGDRAAVAQGRRLAKQLGARCVVLPSAPGPAYHAAAALVANGGAALAYAGAVLLTRIGFDQRAAEHALGGLLASVAQNVGALGVPASLTGPVARGDVATVTRHLDAVAALEPPLADAYAALQPIIVATARAAGLDARTARAILRASRR